MPYIKQEDKEQVRNVGCRSAGELNYYFTKEIQDYIDKKGLSYQVINDIVGALEGAKLEFYRRVAVPYENKKIFDNGDVYHGF
jgi:hypothetical protein